MGFDIAGFGTIAIDDYLYVSSFPEPDRKALVLEKRRDYGGLIGTSLAAAAHLGLRCAYGGIIGADDLSMAVMDELQRHSVNISHAFPIEKGDPVHSIIVADKTNHTRNIFYTGREEPELAEEDLVPLITGSRAVLVDQSGLQGAEIARRLGVPVIADLEWEGRTDITRYLQAVDHLIIPETAALAVTGAGCAETALEDLHSTFPRTVTLVTSGDEGCRYIAGVTSRKIQVQESFPVEIEETNGCGDVFHGAYAAALVQGNTITETVRFAAAAAAVYASRKNGWDNLPSLRDVENLLRAS